MLLEILNLRDQNLQAPVAPASVLKTLPLLLVISQVWEPRLQLTEDIIGSTCLNKKQSFIKHVIYASAILSHFYCDFPGKRTQRVEAGCFK